MTTIWPLPRLEISAINSINENRPAALLTGPAVWDRYGRQLNIPIVIQAEPHNADAAFFDELGSGLPPEVEVIYALGGGLVSDAAKYIGWKNQKPVVTIPTALSVDGYFTALSAVRQNGTVHYETTGPAEKVIIDWEIIRNAPPELRGTGICELLSSVTGLLDWQYAAERNRNTPETRYIPWAAKLMAGIAQQAFIIAKGVGQGKIEALKSLLDLLCVEVQLTNQLGHNRPQEGSEQFFAYAIENKTASGYGVPYADLVGPGILIAASLHGQNVNQIRDTIDSAGVRLDQLRVGDIRETMRNLPDYVKKHNLPYSIWNEFEPTDERINQILSQTGLDSRTA